MTTAICVLRSGGRYGSVWAERLAAGLRRHVPGIERCLCLTDLDAPIPGCEVAALRHVWPGWWSKFEAFRPGLCDGPALLCDLDNVLTGPAPELTADTDLAVLEDQTFAGRASSALMRFDAAEAAFLYDRFAADPERWMDRASCPDAPNRVHGDQVVIDRFLRDEGIAPAFWQRRHPGLVQIRWSEAQPVEAAIQVFVHRCKPDGIGGPVAAAWRGEAAP
jgi:hypothetical protein